LGEDGVFQGAGALEAPLIFGDGLGELIFESADGGKGYGDETDVMVEGFLVRGRGGVDLAAKSVAERIFTGAVATGIGDGTGAELRVGAVGGEFGWRHK
jgi:hypothetical protein